MEVLQTSALPLGYGAGRRNCHSGRSTVINLARRLRLRQTGGMSGCQPEARQEGESGPDDHHPSTRLRIVLDPIGQIHAVALHVRGAGRAEAESDPEVPSGSRGRAVIPGSPVVHERTDADGRELKRLIGEGEAVLRRGEEGPVAGESVLAKGPGPDPQTKVEFSARGRIDLPAARGVKDRKMTPRGYEVACDGQLHRARIPPGRSDPQDPGPEQLDEAAFPAETGEERERGHHPVVGITERFRSEVQT